MAGADRVAAERCPKYPSMLRAHCSHCRGTVRGTEEHPVFSVREGFDSLHGYPVIEVLKNGAAIHARDSHFRFGRRKAEIILACLPALQEFWSATDSERLAFRPRVFIDNRRGAFIQVSMQMHPDFETSGGRYVDRPWLFLQGVEPSESRIGLGAMKCRAICAVQKEIAAWLDRVS